APLTKISRSGQKVISLPVAPRLPLPTLASCPPSANFACGPSPVKVPGTPRRKDIPHTVAPRVTRTSNRDDSAFTTDDPTPCRPPVALYEPAPNLPPACSLVKTTSTPLSPVRRSE